MSFWESREKGWGLLFSVLLSKGSVSLECFWEIGAVFASIPTTISTLLEVFFGHDAVAIFAHVKVFSFFKAIAEFYIIPHNVKNKT